MITKSRNYTILDRVCLSVDQVIRTLSDTSQNTGRMNPAENIEQSMLSEQQMKHSAGLMRVNHAGEVCAQALYHGQALFSLSEEVAVKMREAAVEEGDHLKWCKLRLDELGSHTSYLNPFWYSGSFCIGMIAGMIGDKLSLGFVAETERQVVNHLEKQLALLPEQDLRSAKILQQMEEDESKHRNDAIASGAKELPEIIKAAMALVSKIMVKTSYWI